MKTHVNLLTSPLIILGIRNFSDKVLEKIRTHILCSITFYQKPCRLRDNVKNYGTASDVTDDNMAHARCMRDI
jgi:hypothetical protein